MVPGHFEPRHFCPNAEVSVRYFSTSAKLSGQIGTGAEVSYGHIGSKEDTSAPSNTGPSHGKADGCTCVIT